MLRLCGCVATTRTGQNKVRALRYRRRGASCPNPCATPQGACGQASCGVMGRGATVPGRLWWHTRPVGRCEAGQVVEEGIQVSRRAGRWPGRSGAAAGGPAYVCQVVESRAQRPSLRRSRPSGDCLCTRLSRSARVRRCCARRCTVARLRALLQRCKRVVAAARQAQGAEVDVERVLATEHWQSTSVSAVYARGQVERQSHGDCMDTERSAWGQALGEELGAFRGRHVASTASVAERVCPCCSCARG